MQPTSEQSNCVDAFSTGKRLRINAYAGTGKTATLQLLAKSTNRLGSYMAFNKSIADEARRKFPRTVECSTTHSLAYKALINKFGSEKMTGRVNGGFLSWKMQLRPTHIGPVTLTARGHGFLVAQTLKNWQHSGRSEINWRDVPRDGKLLEVPASIWGNAAIDIVSKAKEAWVRAQTIGDAIPLGFDGFLKLWALGRPQLQGDYILLDEAQDTNGVVLELVRHQQAQVICVGDRHQEIYAWRGSINAMVELPTDIEARLSTSFRFGPAIADYATTVLGLLGETLPLKGNPARESVVGSIEQPRTILYRTNGRLIEDLIAHVQDGKKPFVVGGTDEIMSFVKGAEQLMAGQATESPFELFGFNDWTEVQAATHTDGGEELRRWVTLIDKHGTAGLRKAIEGLPRQEAEAAIVLSTGHKSKGREWDSVRLQDDFLLGVKASGDDGDQPDPRTGELPLKKMRKVPLEELRLLYVAATRGQSKLEVSPMIAQKLDRVREIIAENKREAA